MSGPETRPVDEVAAELIAADVANAQVLGRVAKTTSTALILPGRTGPPWVMIGIVGAVLIALVGGGALAVGFLGGAPAIPPATTVAVASATPAAAPTPTATPTPTPTATPPAITIAPPTASPSPTSSPTPSPTPPATGQSLAIGTFDRSSGACPIAETFDGAVDFVADNGALTLTQQPIKHITTGTVIRTGDSEGTFVTAAEGQTYEGTITGSTVRGVFVHTADGCDDTYDFELMLFRPFLAPPPFGTAPAHFELLDAESFRRLLELPAGQAVHLVVASLGDPDMTTLLPIRVVLQVDGIAVWDFMIEGDPSSVCRGPTGCSADAPSEVDPAWLAPDQRPLLVAYDRDGAVIAVYAPNGMP